MSCVRPFQLRRQHSATCESIHRQQSTSKDSRRSRLQKQLSVEPSAYARDISGPTAQSHKARRSANIDGAGWSQAVPEASLRICTAYKSNNNNNSYIRCNDTSMKVNECVPIFFVLFELFCIVWMVTLSVYGRSIIRTYVESTCSFSRLYVHAFPMWTAEAVDCEVSVAHKVYFMGNRLAVAPIENQTHLVCGSDGLWKQFSVFVLMCP